MQANQTQVLTYTLTLPMAFVTTGVYLNIIAPDGTNLSDQIGSASPNTSQATQQLNCIFTPTMAGQYTAVWKVYLGTQLLTYPANFFVVWTDIYDSVRGMLGASLANISDSMLDREFKNIDTILHNYAQSLSPYYKFDTLSSTYVNSQIIKYSDGYDQGLSKLLAAKIRPYIGGKRPTGEVSLFKKGTTTVQYSVGNARNPITIEKEWYDEGMAILEANIPEINAVAYADRTEDEIMSRGDLAAGNRHPTGNWYAEQYGDLYNYLYGFNQLSITGNAATP